MAPSRTRLAVHAALLALSLGAFIGLPVSGLALVSILPAAGLVGLWFYRRETVVAHLVHDGSGLWSWSEHGYWHRGTLGSGCYRSRLLVVLTMAGETGGRQRLCIWRDSLPLRDFSYLQLQLLLLEREALDTRALPQMPVRRTRAVHENDAKP